MGWFACNLNLFPRGKTMWCQKSHAVWLLLSGTSTVSFTAVCSHELLNFMFASVVPVTLMVLLSCISQWFREEKGIYLHARWLCLHAFHQRLEVPWVRVRVRSEASFLPVFSRSVWQKNPEGNRYNRSKHEIKMKFMIHDCKWLWKALYQQILWVKRGWSFP